VEWIVSYSSGIPATTGTVMLSVLPILVGIQMILFFLSYDIGAEPKRPVQRQSVLASLDPAHLAGNGAGEAAAGADTTMQGGAR
jgi:hypothetical protein